MPHLKLVSLLSGVFAFVVVALVNFALTGQLSIGDIVTAVAIGFGTGLGSFLLYRNRPIKNCRK